ncbi:MAG TPA: hypothetical protein VHE35_25285 [Kofleriaceae bacterium]|nr:hypothetical protein [Kofleriaceae bacterium]
MDRTAKARNARGKRPQPHAFWKAAAIALFPLLPAIGAAIWLLARLGVGNQQARIVEVLRLTVVFAGVATVVTGGGVGRLAAEAGVDGGRRRAAWIGGRTMALAGAALAILAAIPQGELPTRWPGWAAIMATGAVVGGGGGALIGLLVGGPLPTLTELGVPEALQVDPIRALRRAGQRVSRRRRT